MKNVREWDAIGITRGIHITCTAEYNQLGSELFVCRSNGTWRTDLSCHQKYCKIFILCYSLKFNKHLCNLKLLWFDFRTNTKTNLTYMYIYWLTMHWIEKKNVHITCFTVCFGMKFFFLYLFFFGHLQKWFVFYIFKLFFFYKFH